MQTSTLLLLWAFSFLGLIGIVTRRRSLIIKARNSIPKNSVSVYFPEEKEIPQTETPPRFQEKKSEPPHFPDFKSILKRAEILIESKNTEEAERLLVSLLAKDRYHLPTLHTLSQLYITLKQYRKAEVLFRTIIEREAPQAKTLSNLAFCLFELNEIEESYVLYTKALALDPETPKRYTNVGQIAFIKKDYETAISVFEKASKLTPRDTNTLFMLADTYTAAQKYHEAKAVFNKILYYEPYNQAAKQEMMRLHTLIQ